MNLISMPLSFLFGVVRALGTQNYISIVSIVCYYLVSIPMAAVLAFKADWGIEGLWAGYYIGVTV